jgi:glycosyltransferase involved in cell wall biosynthesis
MAALPPQSFSRVARRNRAGNRHAGKQENARIARLLICSRSHAPHGGADRIIADLCRELPRRGWGVTLGLTQGERFNDVGRYVEVLGDDLPVRVIDGRRGTRAARIRALRQVIRDEAPDVVLSMRVFDAYEAVGLEKESGRVAPRLAVGVRSFEAPYFADLSLYRDGVDLCVTSGELIAAAAIRHCGMDAQRVVSIGGGVHGPLEPVIPRRPRRPLRLLYAGRLDNEQKRIFDMPPFLDRLEARGIDFTIDIAGAGPAEPELRSLLSAREAAGSVTFHGWLERQELYRRLYPKVDCFVHFAGWEGMTIAPREAMAHGVVPVITRFSGIRLEGQFRDNETALTFPVGDVDAAAACVGRLLAEPGLLERLSAEASGSQAGRYSFEGSMNAWAEALNRCMTQPMLGGRLPMIRDRSDGRLARLGIPNAAQEWLRSLAGRKVRHASPGSEWPTSSGTLGEDTRQALRRLAQELEDSDSRG